jgi:AraC family transcriptional regulator
VHSQPAIDDGAESAQLSLPYFVRAFHHSTGHSPHQYVLRQRVERAKEILTRSCVLDVALACGFRTQQHFARVFRLICGASPSEYRREFL